MKTRVIVIESGEGSLKKGAEGYIDGYVTAADNKPYAVVVSGETIDFVPVWSLKVIVDPETAKVTETPMIVCVITYTTSKGNIFKQEENVERDLPYNVVGVFESPFNQYDYNTFPYDRYLRFIESDLYSHTNHGDVVKIKCLPKLSALLKPNSDKDGIV